MTDLSAQVIPAAAGGLAAAAAINADLIAEETQQAVTAYRHRNHQGAGMPDESEAQQFWDERYRSHHHQLWSGEPNRYLVSELSGLAPGTALDAGCGEGADAIWLATRGWRVTGVDVSSVALERAAAAAAEKQVAERVDWQHADLADFDPDGGRYDLVTSHYLHLPAADRVPLFDRLAAAVRPGGSLLIVGHHPSDLQTTVGRPREPELFFTGDDIAARLDPVDWEIVTNAAPGREATDADGNCVTIHDSVLQARRRG